MDKRVFEQKPVWMNEEAAQANIERRRNFLQRNETGHHVILFEMPKVCPADTRTRRQLWS